MTEKNDNEHIDEHDTTDDSPEFDEMVSSFEKAESQRRKKGMIYLLVGLMIAGGVFLLAFVYRSEVFGPPIDVEQGEEEILAKTDDPQCRDMIAQVQDLSARYFKLEPTIDEELLGDDAEAIQGIRDEVARLQQRLDEIEEFSREANLRFDESSQELKEWFDYVELELSFVDRLAKERLAALKAAESSELKVDAGTAKTEDTSKTSEGEQEGVVVEKSEATKKKEKQEREKAAANKQTPKERKEGALIAIHDAFQKFRVWHSSSAHPCGAADEGETPWRPAKQEAASKQEGASKEAAPAE
jgi:hypothetical protein